MNQLDQVLASFLPTVWLLLVGLTLLRTAVAGLRLPQTDIETIWPMFWQHRGGFFAAHCHCFPDGRNEWTMEQSSARKS